MSLSNVKPAKLRWQRNERQIPILLLVVYVLLIRVIAVERKLSS